MTVKVIHSGDSSNSFEVTNGIKQGCVLAPLLFNVFAMMLNVAFKNCKGIYLQLRLMQVYLSFVNSMQRQKSETSWYGTFFLLTIALSLPIF